jgi:hypothetical protein
MSVQHRITEAIARSFGVRNSRASERPQGESAIQIAGRAAHYLRSRRCTVPALHRRRAVSDRRVT